jgi:hypothetical protein
VASPAYLTPQDIERDIAIRRNLENVFGLVLEEDEELPLAEEGRLARGLRAAALI